MTVVLMVAAFALIAFAQEPTFVVGKPAPALRLPTVDGGPPVALDSFRGRKVLLIEFASW